MPEFILLIREDLTRYPIPDAELKSLVKAHTDWAKDLSKRGIFKAGYGIDSAGSLLTQIDGEIIELPLRDVEEGIGGFYIIEADDLVAAIEVGRECPTFKAGDSIEVRPLS
jgi:hypothetical protein